MLVAYPHHSVSALGNMHILHELVRKMLSVCSTIPMAVGFVLAGGFNHGFPTATVCLPDGYYLSNLTSANYWHGFHLYLSES